jgi:hypothetical protein
MRQHTSAYVSIRQHTQPQSAASRGKRSCPDAYVSIRIAYVYLDGVRSRRIRAHERAARHSTTNAAQHTFAYVRIRQHTSAYVSIRPKSTYTRARESSEALNAAYVSIRQHTSAYVRYLYRDHEGAGIDVEWMEVVSSTVCVRGERERCYDPVRHVQT